ncbi:zf-CCHC domain-containing protein [Tanacetum coccineum]
MDFNLNNKNDPWEPSLDIDDSDLHLTPVLRPSSSTIVEPSSSTLNPVRIIPGLAGIVQAAKLLKQRDILFGLDGAVMSTQEYMKKVVEDVSEDEDFKSGAWVNATNYVNANGDTVTGCLRDIKNFLKNRKIDQVVAIVRSCSPNAISDLTVTMKDLSGIIPGTIHYKVIGDGGYENDITVGAALILVNVSVFSPKPSMHYLNIIMLTLDFNFFSSTMGTVDSVKSILTQSALDALCEKCYIPDAVHLELPDRNDRIRNSLTGKIGLSAIAVAKVSHFEILCRVHGFVRTVEMDLFAFINHADPTKVRIGEREGAGDDDVNAAEANQTEQGEHVVDLREDHGTSGIDANTGGKSVAALQSLLESSTLPVEVGVAAAATVPFVTSSVTPDSIYGIGLRIRHPTERFVISSDSSHDLNANATDDEVTSVIMSSMPPPPVLTAAVATTITVGATSDLVHESCTRQVQPSIFRDFASPSLAEADVAGPSQPVGTELSTGSFYVSQDVDHETLRQIYIPK